jgi:hypothetical protein
MSLDPADLLAIQQLYARYCHIVDDADGFSFRRCFTPGGILQVGERVIEGAEALELFGDKMAGRLRGIRHAVLNVALDGTGDTATGWAYGVTYGTDGDQTLKFTGRYQDNLVRMDGEWAFSKRLFRPDDTAQVPD